MKTAIVTTMMALTLNACMAEDDQMMEDPDRLEGENIPLTPTDLLVQVVTWAGSEAASFIAGEIFGLPFPSEAPGLSEADLDQIRQLVAEELQSASFNEYNAKADLAMYEFSNYAGVTCTEVSSNDCSENNLISKRTTAAGISSSARIVYELFEEWHEAAGSTVATDQSWQVSVANTIQTMIAIDLAMLRETYQINTVLGNPEGSAEAWAALTSNATTYATAMEFMGTTYDTFIGQFGAVYDKEDSHPFKTECYFYGCFAAPGGDDCGEPVTVSCGEDDLGFPSDEEMAKLLADAQARLDARKAHLSAAVGDRAQFQVMTDSIKKLSTMPQPVCEPVKNIDAGPLSGNDAATMECPGKCEAAGGSFNGQWWSERGTSLCQCEFKC